MASTGTKQRSSSARRAHPETSKNGRAAGDKNRAGSARSKSATPTAAAKKRASAAGGTNGTSAAGRKKGSSSSRGENGKSSARGENDKSSARGKTGRSSAGAKNEGSSPKKDLGSPVRRAKEAVTPDHGLSAPNIGGSKIMRKMATKAAKAIAMKSLRTAATAVRAAADRTASAGRNAVETSISNRLPIQVSVDVAVPIQFAWDEWMDFGSIPEGVHRIEDVERDGDSLYGRLSGPRSADWEAEIVDERKLQSFAWRSVEGTDTAGLVTFHSLSDRLTRIELDLDVLPTNPAEALTMASHIAHRRAEADLRRFKAHVEFISPDVYESEASSENGASG